MNGKLPIRAKINETIIELHQGDITHQDTDAIVNAANSTLLGGGGVDGAIHRAAGPQLLEETRTLGGCKTGDAKISKGYKLRAKHVIHAVGPIYHSHKNAAELLARTHRRSLEVAAEHNITSIAFPAISTGVYGYPLTEAAPIALRTICEFAAEQTDIKLVRFVLFSADVTHAFAQALDKLVKSRRDLAYA